MLLQCTKHDASEAPQPAPDERAAAFCRENRHSPQLRGQRARIGRGTLRALMPPTARRLPASIRRLRRLPSPSLPVQLSAPRVLDRRSRNSAHLVQRVARVDGSSLQTRVVLRRKLACAREARGRLEAAGRGARHGAGARKHPHGGRHARGARGEHRCRTRTRCGPSGGKRHRASDRRAEWSRDHVGRDDADDKARAARRDPRALRRRPGLAFAALRAPARSGGRVTEQKARRKEGGREQGGGGRSARRQPGAVTSGVGALCRRVRTIGLACTSDNDAARSIPPLQTHQTALASHRTPNPPGSNVPCLFRRVAIADARQERETKATGIARQIDERRQRKARWGKISKKTRGQGGGGGGGECRGVDSQRGPDRAGVFGDSSSRSGASRQRHMLVLPLKRKRCRARPSRTSA